MSRENSPRGLNATSSCRHSAQLFAPSLMFARVVFAELAALSEKLLPCGPILM